MFLLLTWREAPLLQAPETNDGVGLEENAKDENFILFVTILPPIDNVLEDQLRLLSSVNVPSVSLKIAILLAATVPV